MLLARNPCLLIITYSQFTAYHAHFFQVPIYVTKAPQMGPINTVMVQLTYTSIPSSLEQVLEIEAS